MKNVLPFYERPLKPVNEPFIEVPAWEKAMDAYDEKKFREAALQTLRYINKDVLDKIDTDKSFTIATFQGLIKLQIEVTDDHFRLRAPFLKIGEDSNKIALLRRVNEVNFYPLTLTQLRLRNDILVFEFDSPLANMHPYKLYDALKDAALYGDDYQDEFVENYAAKRLHEDQKIDLAEKEQAWKQIKRYLDDYQTYSKFFEEKRWNDFQWDLAVITILKLANMPYIQGEMKSRLGEYIRNMFNGDIDFNFRVNKGRTFLKEISEYSKEKWFSYIYLVNQFMTFRWRSSDTILKDHINKFRENVENMEQKEDHFLLSYFLQANLLKVLYEFRLETDYQRAIETALEKSSGLEPREAVKILLPVFKNLQKGNLQTTVTNAASPKKKGLLTRLFGKK